VQEQVSAGEIMKKGEEEHLVRYRVRGVISRRPAGLSDQT